jgi:iron complex outermembrane receptor protein
MNLSKQYLLMMATAASFIITAPAQAQSDSDDGLRGLEEIVVTARKREENVVDVPVSITVFGASEIAARGIRSQQELFDATPNLTFDVNTDGRQGTNPGIRGVQSALIATNQQKVNNFVDGMPMLGSSGTLQFDGIEAVEVYRGPQSAAFGRATFAGAINYVTADSAEEFGGKVELAGSDLGDKHMSVAITGPMGDALGYRLAYLKSEWGGPDEWTSTDGLEMGKQTTEQIRAKLNFQFSDSAYGEIMYNRLDTDDNPGVGFAMNPEGCTGDSGIWRNSMGADVQQHSSEWDCDPSVPAGGIPRNHNALGQFLGQYDDNRTFYEETVSRNNMGMGFGALDTNGDGMLQSSEYLAQVLPGNGGTFEQALIAQTISNPTQATLRDRFQGEINFEIGDGLLQVMGMVVDETLDRWFEADNGDSLGSFGINMMTMQASLNANIMSMMVHNDISEKYAEVRWISPADKRLRYTLSGSWYEFDLQGQVFNAGGALVEGLIAPNGNPVNPLSGISNSEVATNIGLAFGLQYDFTDKTTFSLEGRFQEDENCGTAAFDTGSETFCETTEAFLPRIALSYAFTDNHQGYVQYSIGNNPAGVNIAYQDPGNIQALQVATGQIVNPADGFTYDGTDGIHFPTVTYDETTFTSFDEETLYNFEIGSKGSYAGGNGSYAAAVYYMIYEDMIGAENLNWNDTDVNGWNETNWTIFTGERTWINGGDGEFYGLELTTDYAFNDVWRAGGYLVLQSSTYKDFCSIQAPEYRDAPGGAGGGGNSIIPILSPENGDAVPSACGVVDGNDVPRNSPVTASLNVNATLPNEVGGLTTSFRADLRYANSYYLDHMNLLEMPAVTTLNLSAVMRNDHWNLRLFVNNVTDEDQPANVSGGNFYNANPDPSLAAISAGSWVVVQRRPREIGLTASFNF